MSRQAQLIFKVATEPEEFEQIHELNYLTFVEEIPQHERNDRRRLVDPLLGRSVAFICLEGDRVVGMVTASGERPFSLDRKLPELDRHLPANARPCEVRLLAVRPGHRSGLAFMGLMRQILDYCDESGYDILVFSATATQERMYRHAGCQPFGPPLGTPEAPFRGMYLTRQLATKSVRRVFGLTADGDGGGDGDGAPQ